MLMLAIHKNPLYSDKTKNRIWPITKRKPKSYYFGSMRMVNLLDGYYLSGYFSPDLAIKIPYSSVLRFYLQ